MINQQRELRRRHSSLLELEAAEYFELELDELLAPDESPILVNQQQQQQQQERAKISSLSNRGRETNHVDQAQVAKQSARCKKEYERNTNQQTCNENRHLKKVISDQQRRELGKKGDHCVTSQTNQSQFQHNSPASSSSNIKLSERNSSKAHPSTKTVPVAQSNQISNSTSASHQHEKSHTQLDKNERPAIQTTTTRSSRATRQEVKNTHTPRSSTNNPPVLLRDPQQPSVSIVTTLKPSNTNTLTTSDYSCDYSLANAAAAASQSPIIRDSATGSSSSTTSYLPSVSSSASVSPLLVCPHLTLDDILTGNTTHYGQYNQERGTNLEVHKFISSSSSSPHTIGLCSECRLNAPANIQSPLSPAFKPTTTTTIPLSPPALTDGEKEEEEEEVKKVSGVNVGSGLRRFHSDHQVSSHRNRQAQHHPPPSSQLGPTTTTTTTATMISPTGAYRRRGVGAHEDSLDFGIDSKEARELKLSATLRHSVEYIRNNFTEVGRVLLIHKNGEPFEKPLRISVTRDEFKSLNHLLEHINSRQLIPLGARYLFHLDGQLVYSVNELKHGSTYIVSGTRAFNFKANNLLKEQQLRRKEQQQRQLLCPNTRGRHWAEERRRSHSELTRLPPPLMSMEDDDDEEVGEEQITTNREAKSNAHDNINSSSQKRKTVPASSILNDQQQRTTNMPAAAAAAAAQHQKKVPMGEEGDYSSLKQEKGSNQRKAPTNMMVGCSQSEENLTTSQATVAYEQPITVAVKSKMGPLYLDRPADESYKEQQQKAASTARLVRAKSEFDGANTNKNKQRAKKNVTFFDTGRGSSPFEVKKTPNFLIRTSPSTIMTSVGASEMRHDESNNSSNNDDDDDDDDINTESASNDRNTKLQACDNNQAQLQHDEEESERRLVIDENSERIREEEKEDSNIRALNRNEIGIQVTESIDGFLVDLPLPMPMSAKEAADDGGDRSSKNARGRIGYGAVQRSSQPGKGKQHSGGGAMSSVSANQQQRAASQQASMRNQHQGQQVKLNRRTTNDEQQQASRQMNKDNNNSKTANNTKKRQIVTITERQLSSDEMNKFKELSQADHHHNISLANANEKQAAKVAPPANNNNNNKLVEATSSSSNREQREHKVESVGGGEKHKEGEQAVVGGEQQRQIHWQYPQSTPDDNGENPPTASHSAISSTPTERPISQCGPNELVHARVVATPSPTISSHDSLSLISLSGGIGGGGDGNLAGGDMIQQQQQQRFYDALKNSEVRGRLCSGIDAPKSNFQLTWVNGFTINNEYPENTNNNNHTNPFQTNNQAPNFAQAEDQQQQQSSNMIQQGAFLLSPNSSSSSSARQQQQPPMTSGSAAALGSPVPISFNNQFKPKDRFHNWVCHSRLYDELIYPSGCLVILWSQRRAPTQVPSSSSSPYNNNNIDHPHHEQPSRQHQRFYDKHTANVSALALSSTNLDLAASAQYEQPTNNISTNTSGSSTSGSSTLIHLWSLSKLELLQIIDGGSNSHFGSARIFSLKLAGDFSHLTSGSNFIASRPQQEDTAAGSSGGGGGEITAAARDDKRIHLYNIKVPPPPPTSSSGGGGITKKPVTVIKVSKSLMANQTPLLVSRLGAGGGAAGSSVLPDQNGNHHHEDRGQAQHGGAGQVILSFGRRHFQVWSREKASSSSSSVLLQNKKNDNNNNKLILMKMVQATNEDQSSAAAAVAKNSSSPLFVNIIPRATCMMQPDSESGRIIIGDSEGNISMLELDWLGSSATAAAGRMSSKEQLQKHELASAINYKMDAVYLYNASLSSSSARSTSQQTSPRRAPAPAITCLARVSSKLFASADSTCVIKFWRLHKSKTRAGSTSNSTAVAADGGQQEKEPPPPPPPIIPLDGYSCKLVASVCLPNDLGFICTIVISKYNRRPIEEGGHLVEFYFISTSNAILFGQARFPSHHTSALVKDQQQPVSLSGSTEINVVTNNQAPSWTLSVVYEGHESPVTGLVADGHGAMMDLDSQQQQQPTNKRKNRNSSSSTSPMRKKDDQSIPAAGGHGDYFTCSRDCKICKWNDKNLIWKSMLPSACASMALHPIGFVLAVGSADGTVYILDKFSGLLISYFPLTPVCINCLAYSRDGLLLAAGCSNGSIFILPVQEHGLKYKKVSIFQSPYPVISLQFSLDSRFLLTSVTHHSYQELILWDLPNFRYMRDNVKLEADKIKWFNAICSSSEDVRAIWENANLSFNATNPSNFDFNSGININNSKNNLYNQSSSSAAAEVAALRRKRNSFTDSTTIVVNLSCDRLVRSSLPTTRADGHEGLSVVKDEDDAEANFVIASDMRGYLRLFKYPAYDIQQAFYEIRVTSSPMNCCRFLAPKNKLASKENVKFVSTSADGSICLWTFVGGASEHTQK